MISSFTASVTGATVTYSVVTCNKGIGGAGSFYVDVYYDRATPPGVGDYGELYQDYPGLAAGACVTTTLTRTATPAGGYASWAQVDADGLVAESNESNNVAGPIKVSVGTAAGADLTIKSFTAQVMAQTTVRYQVQVCNGGTGASGATTVHVYYNRASAPPAGQSGDQLAAVPNLAAGACTTQNLYRYGTPAGSYASWAQVDPQNTVPESNESNNVAGPVTVTVGGPSQKANLAITQFTAQVSGTTINFATTVCNSGAVSASSFRLDLYYNRATAPQPGDLGDVYDLIPQLAAGACTVRNRSATNLKAGVYTSWAQVDTTNVVSESNEQNNVAGPRVSVVAGPVVDCTAICALAVSCGIFTAAQLAQCASWCQNLPTASKQCAAAAAQSGGCTALKACNLPPPPPPPPPPGVCPDLCGYLISPCNLLPTAQYWACVGACENLAPDRLQCAQDAKAKGQCMQVVTCLF